MSKRKQKIFMPTIYEAVSLSIAGTGLLVLTVILSAAKDYDVRNYNFFSTTAKNFIDVQLQFLDTPRWATLLTFILWMICGILVYLAIWFVVTVFKDYREDSLPLHGFLTPRSYNRSGEVFTAVARGLIRFIAIISTIISCFFLLRTITPYLTHVFAAALSPITFSSVPTMVVAGILEGASFYVLIVCLRFVFLRKRLIGSNITD